MFMENFVSTVIFVLPGFCMYFFIQTFGVNAVVKHNAGEIVSFSALLWFPVSFSSLAILNLFFYKPIWTLAQLKDASDQLDFLLFFFIISICVGFILSALYAKYIYPVQIRIINTVRSWRNLAPLSHSPSVWDEIFHSNEKQIVGVTKLTGEEPMLIGSLAKASRTYEQQRDFCLIHINEFTTLVNDHKIPVDKVFIDLKAGLRIVVYDQKAVELAVEKENGAQE